MKILKNFLYERYKERYKMEPKENEVEPVLYRGSEGIFFITVPDKLYQEDPLKWTNLMSEGFHIRYFKSMQIKGERLEKIQN
jgi:hypothetical protein